jgi:hypothetical protein
MMKQRPDAWCPGLSGTSSTMESSIVVAPQASFNGAFPLKKVRHYSSSFMKGIVGVMLHQGAWSERLSDKVFTS